MKFSLWPNPSRPPAEVLSLAQYADDGGWHCIWYADHYMPNTGDNSFEAGDVHECWTMLAAIATATSRIRLGPLVAPTSVHHPALLANRAATLDQLSDGRFTLGLGAGWQINEHAAYGIELEAPGVRVSRFEESIQVVRSLLDKERTTFSGSHYDITDAPCDPKPVQDLLPIVVGTGSPRMLSITAKYAQEWNTWGAPALATTRYRAFLEACDSTDTDPESLHTSVQAMFFMTDDEAKAEQIRSSDVGERSIAGSDEYIVDQLGQFAELGFDEVIVPDFTLGSSDYERRESYERFSADIASEF